MNITKLHSLVAAVCPIAGVNSDGQISFLPEATAEQRAAAEGVVAANIGFLGEGPPESVTMRQARLALLQSGLLADVNAAVAAMSGSAGDTARIEWEFSSTVERHRPLVEALGVALGLTDAQLDDLFRLAGTL